MKSFFFVGRVFLAWFCALAALFVIAGLITGFRLVGTMLIGIALTLAWVIVTAVSHVHRVRLVSDEASYGSRHRRQVELPFPPNDAFDLVDAAIRELPNVQRVDSARDSLQVHARMHATDPYTGSRKNAKESPDGESPRQNRVHATITPRDTTSSVTLVTQPGGGAWKDGFIVDHGANLENMEAITRAITRRVAERRRSEEATSRDNATQKELTVAKLNLLQAQVEPHFLYNTLASAQVLTRVDPPRADLMLGNLIVYLRHSLPSADDSLSTVGVELERSRAYLEILKIRMGNRLATQLEVPAALESVPLPPMMMQTLVENAIKHGLEPQAGGGNVWIFAREAGDKVSVIVADDGRGFSEDGGGTGVGLRNVRERLRLIYGEAASFSIVANFPTGVTATITVPRAGPASSGAAAQPQPNG
ncbi:MAG: histidine kinase [Usitatibacter sp.]